MQNFMKIDRQKNQAFFNYSLRTLFSGHTVRTPSQSRNTGVSAEAVFVTSYHHSLKFRTLCLSCEVEKLRNAVPFESLGRPLCGDLEDQGHGHIQGHACLLSISRYDLKSLLTGTVAKVFPSSDLERKTWNNMFSAGWGHLRNIRDAVHSDPCSTNQVIIDNRIRFRSPTDSSVPKWSG